MDYGVFKNVIAERIKEFLPSVYSEFDVNVMEVPKINGMRETLKEAAYALDIENQKTRLAELEKEQQGWRRFFKNKTNYDTFAAPVQSVICFWFLL